MSDYFDFPASTQVVACQRCGTVVLGTRIGTHDEFHRQHVRVRPRENGIKVPDKPEQCNDQNIDTMGRKHYCNREEGHDGDHRSQTVTGVRWWEDREKARQRNMVVTGACGAAVRDSQGRVLMCKKVPGHSGLHRDSGYGIQWQ